MTPAQAGIRISFRYGVQRSAWTPLLGGLERMALRRVKRNADLPWDGEQYAFRQNSVGLFLLRILPDHFQTLVTCENLLTKVTQRWA
jgi:hypothetical protein